MKIVPIWRRVRTHLDSEIEKFGRRSCNSYIAQYPPVVLPKHVLGNTKVTFTPVVIEEDARVPVSPVDDALKVPVRNQPEE
jgi:hypothetical protein